MNANITNIIEKTTHI